MILYPYTVRFSGTHVLFHFFWNTFLNRKMRVIYHSEYLNLGNNNIGFDTLTKNQLSNQWQFDNKIKYSKDYLAYDLLLVHHHIDNYSLDVSSKEHILDLLTEQKSEIKIISTMRDPLLAWNSKLFRLNLFNKISEVERLVYFKEYIILYTKLLSISPENVFIFPVDSALKNQAVTHIKLCKQLCKFCGISFNKESLKYAKKWSILNPTEKICPSHVKGDTWYRGEYNPFFQTIKQAILDKNVKLLQKYYGAELTYLKKQDELKTFFHKIGYEGLLWM